jgi:hypothetical protein
MAATNVRFYEVLVASLSSLLSKQFGIESTADADLGYKMSGCKDVTRFLCKDKPVRVTTFKATDAIEIASDKAFNFGDASTNGSWRIVRDGNNLAIQRREAGSWVEKSLIEP